MIPCKGIISWSLRAGKISETITANWARRSWQTRSRCSDESLLAESWGPSGQHAGYTTSSFYDGWWIQTSLRGEGLWFGVFGGRTLNQRHLNYWFPVFLFSPGLGGLNFYCSYWGGRKCPLCVLWWIRPRPHWWMLVQYGSSMKKFFRPEGLTPKMFEIIRIFSTWLLETHYMSVRILLRTSVWDYFSCSLSSNEGSIFCEFVAAVLGSPFSVSTCWTS